MKVILMLTLSVLLVFGTVTADLWDSPESQSDGISSEERYCMPGRTWVRNCQSCTCSPQGVPSCTGPPCPAVPRCFPGSAWTNNGQTCSCTVLGTPACN